MPSKSTGSTQQSIVLTACRVCELMAWHSCTPCSTACVHTHTGALFPCTLGVRGPTGLSLRFVAAAVHPMGVAEGLWGVPGGVCFTAMGCMASGGRCAHTADVCWLQGDAACGGSFMPDPAVLLTVHFCFLFDLNFLFFLISFLVCVPFQTTEHVGLWQFWAECPQPSWGAPAVRGAVLCTHTLRSQGFAFSSSLISPCSVRAAVCGCSPGSQSDSAHLCSLPAGFRLNASSWPMFLLKTLNGAEMAPIRIFHKVLGCLGASTSFWHIPLLHGRGAHYQHCHVLLPLAALCRCCWLRVGLSAYTVLCGLCPAAQGCKLGSSQGSHPPRVLHLLMEVSGDGGADLRRVGTAAL